MIPSNVSRDMVDKDRAFLNKLKHKIEVEKDIHVRVKMEEELDVIVGGVVYEITTKRSTSFKKTFNRLERRMLTHNLKGMK